MPGAFPGRGHDMKNIVICSDGTWNSPDQEQATNVLRLSRAIAPGVQGGTKQVVFYDWGVGSDRKKLTGGMSGAGIDKNIQDAYRFLVHNYNPGDRLYFFGFSRGAYTVRSLAGFIRNCGLLKREHADRIPACYAHYRKRSKGSHPESTASCALRTKYAVADRTPIRFIGVWDTVGSLGVPVTFWGLLDNDEYLFHDVSPSSIIETARQALAIDENRDDFAVVPWDPKPGIDLKQVWFAGVHADVGGGYEDNCRLSEIPCRWILDEAKAAGLAVEPHLPDALRDQPGAKQHKQPTGIYKLRGKKHRELKQDDLFHVSVKERYEKLGKKWESPAFKGFFRSVDKDWTKVNLEG